MKNKLLNMFLVILLILSLMGVGLVIYAKFFYESSEKEKPNIDDSTLITSKISDRINDSLFAESYLRENKVTANYSDNSLIIKTGVEDSNEYIFPCENNIISISINSDLTSELQIQFTHIIVNALGELNGYSEGYFIETVNRFFEGEETSGLSLINDVLGNKTVKINTVQTLVPYQNDEAIEIMQNKQMIFASWQLLDITKKDYVVYMNDYVIYNISIEHNSTYNIAKIDMDVKYLGNDLKEFVVISKLFNSDTTSVISEVEYPYAFTESKPVSIKINHMFKNENDYELVKYFGFEIKDK